MIRLAWALGLVATCEPERQAFRALYTAYAPRVRGGFLYVLGVVTSFLYDTYLERHPPIRTHRRRRQLEDWLRRGV